MSTRKDRIESILNAEFNPEFIEVIDNSKEHYGHHGFDANSQETHLKINITAKTFSNLRMLESHKMIYNALINEFKHGLHALEINVMRKD